MKPNADMITKILHNFRVNGKFDQDRLIIGRGVDEQLQLMITDTIGIRYVPNGGSNPNIEYTNDGNTWHGFGEQGTVDLTYEPIEFNASHLSGDGKITIQHNFNNKNVLCLGYTPQPKEIEYLDNQLVLDYSDQNEENLTGSVWFVNSLQSMLIQPYTSTYVISGCTIHPEANGTYGKVPQDNWNSLLANTGILDFPDLYDIKEVYVNENQIAMVFYSSDLQAIVWPTQERNPYYNLVNFEKTETSVYVDYFFDLRVGQRDDTAKLELYTDENTEHTYVYTIANAGTADVNGNYWEVPQEEWGNYFNGPNLTNMQGCWTNGTYYLTIYLSSYPYTSWSIQIMGYKVVDGVPGDSMVNFYTCAPFAVDGDITTATFQVAHGDSPAPTVKKIS